MLNSDAYTIIDDLESIGYCLISLLKPAAECFPVYRQGDQPHKFHNEVARAKEKFLQSNQEPPLCHLIDFINAVRSQREKDPIAMPDYDSLL